MSERTQIGHQLYFVMRYIQSPSVSPGELLELLEWRVGRFDRVIPFCFQLRDTR